MSARHSKEALPLLVLGLSLGAVSCDDTGGPERLLAKMEIEPSVVDFGPVQVGTTQTIDVLIRNRGRAILNLSNLSKGSPFDDAFTFEIDKMALQPNAIAVLTINFAPQELGERNARLIVRASNDEVEDQEIDLLGEGVTTSLVVEPQSLSFGNVVINTTKQLSLTLSNSSGTEAFVELRNGLGVGRCGAAGSSAAPFCARLRDRQVGPDSRFKLEPNEVIEMIVEFSPTTATSERGALSLIACDTSACEVEVTLSGVGVEQGFQCDPTSVDFGQVNPGSCLSRTVSCANIANERITVVSWGPASQGGGTSLDFQIEPSSVQSLNEGDSIDVDINYCPVELGDDVGTLAIETDNIDQRLRTVFIPLRGTGGGPDIQVLPDQLNFGLVSLIAPGRRDLLILNNGQDALDVHSIQIAGDNESFQIEPGSPTSGRVEAGGAPLRVTVRFLPVMEGPVQSSLAIQSNDQDEPELTVPLIGEGINLPPCSYQLAPGSIGFGAVERGRVVGRAIEVRNTGDNDCLITGVRFAQPGTDPEFSLPEGEIMSELIPPGAAKAIRVEYVPQDAGTHSGVLELGISDPNNPEVEVTLSGTGVDASLLIVPNDVDFGTIGVGCGARARTVTIYNTGGLPATIDSVQITGNQEAFRLDSLPAPLPSGQLVLAPGASTEFSVGFRAELQSDYAGAVEITGTFEDQPVTYIVSLQGRGDDNAIQVDEFEQLGRPKVDILFIVDDSGTMSQEQAALSANFDAFIEFAEAQALDYHIGVTTTDVGDGDTVEAGKLVPLTGNPGDRVVTPESQPSPEALFAANANVGIDSLTSNEQGLQAAYLALSNPLIYGHNAGFLRQDAVLSLIFVSDEEDHSPGSVDFFINFFLSIKGFRNTNLFSASAIVGDAPSGCSNGSNGDAEEGLRYIAAAERTGGVFHSICTPDWSRALQDLSRIAFGFKSQFFLTNQPVLSTLRVMVDDVELPESSPQGTVYWGYDFPSNSINFSPAATPEAGSQIRIEYAAECLP